MDGGKAKHHVSKLGLGETGDTDLTVKVRPQGGGNVLQGGGPSNITVWFVDVGPFGNNIKEGRRVTHWLPLIDHGEARAADSRRDMGDARGGSSAESVSNAVGNDIYRETTGKRGTVSGVKTNN